MDAAKPQPPPIINDRDRIVDLVTRDLLERAETGKAKYGTYLQPFNGRSALIDLYQELLDAAMYVKQRILEEEEQARRVEGF